MNEEPDDYGKNTSGRSNTGTLEGDIIPGDITFYRLQSTADCKLRAYIAHGEVLPVATKSFGGVGIFAIPEMGRFYRHVLLEGGYPHHGAVAFGHFGKALYEVFKYIGVPVEEIGYNQPKGVRYKNRKSICIISHKNLSPFCGGSVTERGFFALQETLQYICDTGVTLASGGCSAIHSCKL